MGLQKAADQQIISPELSIEAFAAIITGIIDGMGLQLLTEPNLSKNLVV
ncbi:MAG: hypothetical protein GY699_07890 [Desulfobacteraceae bacterium]|nr:hypothetical protein [Desulfobacteraceae bacterium]